MPRIAKSKNSLVVAAAAIVRSVESPTPSRLSTLRLVADAFAAVSAELAGGEKNAGGGNRAPPHVPGFSALTLAAVAVLIKFPSLDGALHRRAVALLFASAPSAGGLTVSQAVDRARSHLKSLDASASDAESVAAVAAACHTLALASHFRWGGRGAAEDAFNTLARVRGSASVQSAAAHAAARVLEGFPASAPPSFEVVSAAVNLVHAACQGGGGAAKRTSRAGFAFLAGVVAPRLVAHTSFAERLLRDALRALANAPTVERAAWATAAARLAVSSRVGGGSSRLSARKSSSADGAKPAARRQAYLFEGALVSVARIGGLLSDTPTCALAVVAVLKAWMYSLPEGTALIPARVLSLLASDVASPGGAVVLRNAVVDGAIRGMHPSAAAGALLQLLQLFGTAGNYVDAIATDLCSVFLRSFGEQAVSAPNEDKLIRVAFMAVDANFAIVRLAGVRLVAAVAAVLPHRRMHVLSLAVQNVRGLEPGIAKWPSGLHEDGVGRPSRSDKVPSRLSALLGNAVAIAVLIEEGACRAPPEFLRWAGRLALEMLDASRARPGFSVNSNVIINAVRMRAGWAIVCSLAYANALSVAIEGGIKQLCPVWASCLCPTPAGKEWTVVGWGDRVVASDTRCAALAALSACLRVERGRDFRQFAQNIMSACAARLILQRVSLMTSKELQVVATDNSVLLLESFSPEEGRALHLPVVLAELVQLAKCIAVAPPVGSIADVCYFALLMLGEEAQESLASTAGTPASSGIIGSLVGSFSKPAEMNAFLHRRTSLHSLQVARGKPNAFGWMCATEGYAAPVAEEALVKAGKGIAALVGESVSVLSSGTVLDFFCVLGELRPIFSSSLALTVARRVSMTELRERGGVLAMLQVLVGSSLRPSPTGVGGVDYKIEPQEWAADASGGLDDAAAPGIYLEGLAAGAAKAESRASPPGRSASTVASSRPGGASVLLATRRVTSNAYRTLAIKGGASMWAGLTNNVANMLTVALQRSSQPNANMAAACSSVLGCLLAASPLSVTSGVTLGETTKTAVTALSSALANADSRVQAAAALALSPIASATAVESERLMTALSCAWAADAGDAFDGNSTNVEAVMLRVCNHMRSSDGEGETGEPYLSVDVAGSANLCAAVGTGVKAVLASGRHRSNSISKPAASAAEELCAGLLTRDEPASFDARAVGLRGVAEMWAGLVADGRVSDALESDTDASSGRFLPVSAFTLRPTRPTSPVTGRRLDEVLYSALSSGALGLRSKLPHAALSCLDVLIVNCGMEAVCRAFPRLPEALFASHADGFGGAGYYVECMADADGVRRPAYWMGLCQAVALGGKRGKLRWDVGLGTRRLAFRVLRIVVTCVSSASGDVGVLKEVLFVVLRSLRVSPIDPASLRELCGALNVIASVMRTEEFAMSAAVEELWLLVASSLGRRLSTESNPFPAGVIVESCCHWVLASAALDSDKIRQKGVEICKTVFEKLFSPATARIYLRQPSTNVSDTAGVLSMLAAVSMLVATRVRAGLNPAEHALDAEISSRLPRVRPVLERVVVDYAALRGRGGEPMVKKCYARHMPWILVCVNSCPNLGDLPVDEGSAWGDEKSVLHSQVEKKELSELCFSFLRLMLADERNVQRLGPFFCQREMGVAGTVA